MILRCRNVVIVAIMALVITIIALCTSPGASAAQWGDDITSNTTWIPAGNPWIVKNSISILDGGTLNLEPGVIIKFDGRYSIQTFGRGKIVAEGLIGNRIEFISNVPASYNYSFISTGLEGVFRNCTFSYGDTNLIASNDAIVEYSNFSESRTGLRVNGNDVEIIGCVFVKCEVGILVDGSHRTSISDCDISFGIRGIRMTGTTSDALIDHCHINHSQIRGIEVEVSGEGNRIFNCEIRWANQAVLVWNSKDVHIRSLLAEDCQSAIGIFTSSTSSSLPILVERCRMIGNIIGVRLSGAQFININESTFEDNQIGVEELNPIGTGIVFWNNNFLGKQDHVDVYSTTTINWSNEGVGNYWGDYKGEDLDGDGIGDTSYDIDTIGVDEYPLMLPVDFNNPTADAGPDVIVRQHSQFTLDGTASRDDTWIANWTWTTEILGTNVILFGPEPTVIIDIHGNFTAMLRVSDAVGKISFDNVSITVTDADPPWFQTIDVSESVYTGAVLNVSCTVWDNGAVDIVTVDYMFGTGRVNRLDLNRLEDDLWAIDVLIPINLANNFYYSLRARDIAGNINATEYLSVEVVDDIVPEILPNLPTNVTTGDETYLNCSVTDNIGVSNVSVEWWFQEGDHSQLNLPKVGKTWSSSVTVPQDARSPMSVLFHAIDQSGNSASSPTWEVVVYDNDVPTMVAFSTTPGMYGFHRGDEVTFRSEFVDNIAIQAASVEYRYFTTEWESLTMIPQDNLYQATLVIAKDKGNRIWFRFNTSDAAGNILVTGDMEVDLLSQNPRILTIPVEEVSEDERYIMALRAEDPDNEVIELQWQLETNATWLHLNATGLAIDGIPIDDDVGWYVVNISVQDREGGHAWLSFVLTVIDVNHRPTIEIRSPEDGVKAGSILRASGRAIDDGNEIEWVRYQVDTGEWMEAAGTDQWNFDINTKDLSPGTHQINVKGYDGNSESDVMSVSFKVPEPESDGLSSLQAIGLIGAAMVIVAVGIVLYLRRK
jgi:hypothetical protein